jgi:hypothetical protein
MSGGVAQGKRLREDDQDMTAVVNGKRSTTLPVMMSVSKDVKWSGAVDRSFLWQRGVCIQLSLFLADCHSFCAHCIHSLITGTTSKR